MQTYLNEEIQAYKRSTLCESLIVLEGHEFRLDNYPFYRAVYDRDDKHLLLKCGRQVAKSTSMCNRSIINGVGTPFYRSLYIAPSMKQASVFSTSRVDPTLRFSPEIYHGYLSRDAVLNVEHKRFRNGSEIRILYASDNADRIRGISCDEVLYDEVQDMVLPSITPVINECMAEAKEDAGCVVYAGTPKSMENGIEVLWQSSSMDEWVVKCSGCGSWNAPMTRRSIGKTGVICLKCGKNLDMRTGQWNSMNRSPDVAVKGYHISQLILPLNSEKPDRWKRILHKLETYPPTKFQNEVLGESDKLGDRMLALHELQACCRDYKIAAAPSVEVLDGVDKIVAGVDWSGGGAATFTSRTAIWIWGITGSGLLKLLYYEVMPEGNNPTNDVRRVIDLCRKYNVSIVAGDAGGGAIANAMLVDALGVNSVVQIQYGAVKKRITWNGKDRYMVDKTQAIDSMMMLFKRGEVFLPREEYMKTAFDDIMATYEMTTQNGQGRRIWTHSPLVPDDCLHAAVFGWAASLIRLGTVEFYPTDKTDY